MHNPPQTNHRYHGTNRLGCTDCGQRIAAALLHAEIARNPRNYDASTGLFRRPVGFQYGHNLRVLQGAL